MPDYFKNEETENRTHSLCLFGTPEITLNKRCDNCPGWARTPQYYRARCPLDGAEANSFSLERQSEKNDHKVLASSSKQHSPDEAFLSAKMADMKLVGSSADAAARISSKSEPCKRKADIFDQPESSSRNERADEFSHNSAHHVLKEADRKAKYYNMQGALCFVDGSADVKDWIQNLKQQKIFSDVPRTEHYVERCWAISSDPRASLDSLLIQRPLDTVEDHRSTRASELGIRIPGIDIMNTDSLGTHSCQDGIFNVNDPEDRWPHGN